MGDLISKKLRVPQYYNFCLFYAPGLWLWHSWLVHTIKKNWKGIGTVPFSSFWASVFSIGNFTSKNRFDQAEEIVAPTIVPSALLMVVPHYALIIQKYWVIPPIYYSNIYLLRVEGDSCSKGHEFESRHRILDGYFFTYVFVVKFVILLKRWK